MLATGTFDTGTNGNAVATTDPGSATAWNDRSFSNPDSTLTYSNTEKYGVLSCQMVFSATPQPAYVAWGSSVLGASLTTIWGRVYMYHSGLPNTSHIAVRGLDVSRAWEVVINSNIALYDHALSDARILAHFEAGQEQIVQVLSMQQHVFGHNMW